jgi:uncharacterized protein (UPF0212 family)
MDCRVVLEAAVQVYDVSTSEEAIRIAIAKTGEMLNPDLSHVEIDTGERTSPSGEALEPAFIVADEALVALELEMTVYSVERTEHAERVARKEIGQRLEDVPLSVLAVEDVTGETDESANLDDDSEAVGEGSEGEDTGSEGADHSDRDDGQESDADDQPAAGSDDVLPEFEELL